MSPEEIWYEADEGQIKQIVWNLATNGLRAMPQGGPQQVANGHGRPPRLLAGARLNCEARKASE